MLVRFNEKAVSQIMVEPVPQEQVNQYGVVDCMGHEVAVNQSKLMTGIVEKPAIDKAPSNLAVVGRYVLSKAIWPLLAKTPPGAGEEIQLTDAIAELMHQEQVEAYRIVGKSHDCGSKLGYLQANVAYALRHPQRGKDVADYLASLTGANLVPFASGQ